MKYLIISSFELDGHSSGMSIICDTAAAKKKYLSTILTNEEGKFYPIKQRISEQDGSETWYGEWDCGEFVIHIVSFKTFKELCNKEFFCRTG